MRITNTPEFINTINKRRNNNKKRYERKTLKRGTDKKNNITKCNPRTCVPLQHGLVRCDDVDQHQHENWFFRSTQHIIYKLFLSEGKPKRNGGKNTMHLERCTVPYHILKAFFILSHRNKRKYERVQTKIML